MTSGTFLALASLALPAVQDYFGRSLAVTPLIKTAGVVPTKNILAVAKKRQVVVYFRLSPGASDPRQ